jgi:Protein of unknown function (DUF4012)
MSVALRRPAIFATRRSRTVAYGVVVAGGAVAAVLLTRAQPTGLPTADAFWSAALVAVLAVFGATARRWTWFLPAGLAAVVAGDSLAVACAAVAIAVAFVSVLRDTRSRARGALVAALGGLALLRAGPVGFHGLSALLSALAVVSVIVSGYAHAGRRVQARTRRVALVAGATIGLMVVGALLGIVSVQRDLFDGMRAVDAGMAAARDADDEGAAEQLAEAARSLGNADGTLSSWFVSPARSLPVIGPNLDAVGSLAAQASEVAQVTSLAAADADVDALKFVDGRLDPQAVAAMKAPLEQVHRSLELLSTEVDAARSPWLLTPVASRIDDLEWGVDEAIPDAETAIEAVSIAPRLLGADAPRRYLVLFTTPVEARGRTGFPGNYAELVVDDGKLSMPVFGRVAELEAAGQGTGRTLTQPPELVARYGRFGVSDTWRNLTMTPDFPALAIAASELYPQSGGQPIDGVLSVDPAGLAAIMRYTGPIEIPGRAPLTFENTERYLLFDQYVEFQTDNEQRLQVLDDLAEITFDRLTTEDLPGPRALSEDLDPVVDGGHIQFTTLSLDTFAVLHDVGVTGSFLPPEGVDTVSVTTANAGASKIDLFLNRRERYDVRWDPATGDVTGTLTVSLENTAPAEGFPDYVIGNAVGLPRGTNRSFVSIYSPFQLEQARVRGGPAPLQAEVEAGRNVYSTFVDIPPQSTVEVELDLRGNIEGRRYQLDVPVQPFATVDTIDVSVEVAGATPVVTGEATVEGNVAEWSATLDRRRSLSVTALRD